MRAAMTLSGACVLLSACYIAPLGPDGRPYPQQPTTVVIQGPPGAAPTAPAAPQLFTARLYPSNDIAARVGIIAGSVTSTQQGKGVFSIPYNGETLTGEATRTTVGTMHTGIANASSPRGTFVRCNYRMTNATQGTGECTFSDNAQFQLHLGN